MAPRIDDGRKRTWPLVGCHKPAMMRSSELCSVPHAQNPCNGTERHSYATDAADAAAAAPFRSLCCP
jgi:hypothetical protein